MGARSGKVYLDWFKKIKFKIKFNPYLRHSCKKNSSHNVTWGKNTVLKNDPFACVSMEELFSSVPPSKG